MTKSKTIGLAIAAMVSGGVSATAVTAAYGQDFTLRGERVEVVLPYSPGGSADAYGRLIAKYLQPHLPGNPTVIVRNEPGAGAIAGTNNFDANADTDGTMLLVTSTSTQMNYLLQDSRVNYDLTQMTPVVVNPLGMMVYVREELGIESAEELPSILDTPIRSGAHTPTSADLVQLIEFHILGLDVEPVFGLQRGDAKQAFERGEIQISYDNPLAYSTYVEPMVEAGIAKPIYTMGYVDASGDHVVDPAFPDLPTFPETVETVTGEAPSGPAYDAWQTMFFSRVMASKSVQLPRGTSPEIVEAYRQAAEAMTQDPAYIEAIESLTGGYPTLYGQEAADRWQQSLQFDSESREWLRNWLVETYDVSL
ncbi:tricarboxylate transporter [Pelagibacterium nitratireducens]|uniref:Tricarboxylate transporter n=1 Tax=Pelagibacterium nitratireducens TaxID=1046114 RepID=A0ABZ2HYJ0_9HYPH|tara:strand:- start:2200 stop:3294 length:1095 start_codon:yes stop_codon:yes gene_type:complete